MRCIAIWIYFNGWAIVKNGIVHLLLRTPTQWNRLSLIFIVRMCRLCWHMLNRKCMVNHIILLMCSQHPTDYIWYWIQSTLPVWVYHILVYCVCVCTICWWHMLRSCIKCVAWHIVLHVYIVSIAVSAISSLHFRVSISRKLLKLQNKMKQRFNSLRLRIVSGKQHIWLLPKANSQWFVLRYELNTYNCTWWPQSNWSKHI